MSRTRVLVLGATAITRQELRDALASDDFDLVAVLSAHASGLARVESALADVVVVDPGVGASAWPGSAGELARAARGAAVLAIVASGPAASRVATEALAAGATDWIVRDGTSDFATALAAKVRDCARNARSLNSTAIRRAPRLDPLASSGVRRAPMHVGRPACLAIGVSTGGPNALAAVLPALPGDFPLPILIVQHMPPVFTNNLAHSLQASCKLRIREAANDDELAPGLALLAPGDYHMTIARRANSVRVVLNQGPPENFCRPAVDVMLRSVAATFGGDVLTVILTGMGQDGLLGVQELRPLGAQVLVQDEPSSVVWGMPGAVARAGLADAVLPLPEIAPEILRRVSLQRFARGA